MTNDCCTPWSTEFFSHLTQFLQQPFYDFLHSQFLMKFPDCTFFLKDKQACQNQKTDS